MNETFFSRDKTFYQSLIPLMLTLCLQNIVAFSVNMLDNVMLGSYSQVALSGAAIVNQIFFLVQQSAGAFGQGAVAIGSQYKGQGRMSPVRVVVGTAIKLSAIAGIFVFLLCSIDPPALLSLFTTDSAIISEATDYLAIIRWTFVLFYLSSVLMAALRIVETVRISFYISIISLIINGISNYCLIFGKFGFPELGIRGAAIGTLIARIVELAVIIMYMLRVDKKLRLFSENFLRFDTGLIKDYIRIGLPVLCANLIWAMNTPVQTAILGHLSSDAIAANSIATTFYQYLKVVIQSIAAASAVLIGQAVGKGDMREIREKGRTLSALALGIGLILGVMLYILRTPLLGLYKLSDTAMVLADQLIVVMSVVMVTMSYQMSVNSGIIAGGGDTKFGLINNLVSTWLIVMPISFLAAFRWHWPVVAVVMVLQSDQVFKCIPIFLWYHSYRWVKNLTR